MDDTKIRYCFLVDWFDIHAQLTRRYELFFYPFDNSIEMYDVKQHRTFLKRTKSDFKITNFFIGAVINVLSRQLLVHDYGDEYTRVNLHQQLERIFAIVKPNAYYSIGEIINAFYNNGISIGKLRMIKFTQQLAHELLSLDYQGEELRLAIDSLNGGPCVVFELIKNNIIQEIKSLIGPDVVEEAKNVAPSSLSAKYGHSGFKNAIYASKTSFSATKQLDLVFGESCLNIPRTATFKNCTLAIIRPHALASGTAGKVIDAILKENYEITDMNLVHLDSTNANEFIEVYKDVLKEYHLILDQFTSGPLIAMEISGDENIVSKFREFAGPMDPELGKQIRPNSLRARFGVDKIKNSIHVTDLPEDGVLECNLNDNFEDSQ